MGELRQALAAYRGDLAIPDGLLRLCNMNPRTRPDLGGRSLPAHDVVLVEPNTSIEIVLDGIHINRRPIWQLLKPLRDLGPAAVKSLTRWFEKGIGGPNEAARREAAAELMSLIPPDWPRASLISKVLRRAASHAPPVLDVLADLVAEFEQPVGIVLFNWAYMPDGRALSWPAGFGTDVVAAARALALPIFDPADLIREVGVPKALEKDLRHYAAPFNAVVAGPLIDFAFKVRAGGVGGRAKTGR